MSLSGRWETGGLELKVSQEWALPQRIGNQVEGGSWELFRGIRVFCGWDRLVEGSGEEPAAALLLRWGADGIPGPKNRACP